MSALQSVREARDERSARLQEICTQQDSNLQYTEVGSNKMYLVFIFLFDSSLTLDQCLSPSCHHTTYLNTPVK